MGIYRAELTLSGKLLNSDMDKKLLSENANKMVREFQIQVNYPFNQKTTIKCEGPKNATLVYKNCIRPPCVAFNNNNRAESP